LLELSPFNTCYATWLVFKSKYWQNNLGDPIFLKACFVLDTTEHIICKNGELGIYCNIVMRERVFVVWRKTFLGENLLFWGREVFRSQVLQTYFRVILIALSFEIMQDICRRPLLKCIICWDPKLVPHTKIGN
jgi:hypothetical protein